MKAYLTAAFVALFAFPAFADGSTCEETALMIKQLEAEQKSARGTQAQNIKSLLAAAYDTYRMNGCSKK